jgi:hypothetical protein
MLATLTHCVLNVSSLFLSPSMNYTYYINPNLGAQYSNGFELFHGMLTITTNYTLLHLLKKRCNNP